MNKSELGQSLDLTYQVENCQKKISTFMTQKSILLEVNQMKEMEPCLIYLHIAKIFHLITLFQ